MDKKLIKEDISNMKFLMGYKAGKVISEQEQPEIDEDVNNLYLRRRISPIKALIDKNISEVEEEGSFFNDEFEFADNIISWVVQELITSGYSDQDYDELTDSVKDEFGDYILSQYVETGFDFDDEDEY
jgi:hypothetical protein